MEPYENDGRMSFEIEPELQSQPEQEPPKKRRTWLKITALLLAVAILASVGHSLLRSAIDALSARNTPQETVDEATTPEPEAPEQPEADAPAYSLERVPLPDTWPSVRPASAILKQSRRMS